ncbi:tetratricopeptide repeat protein [Nonomuraea sp. NPDC047897]|uniref:nSTAND1 domain-containing NTPase n=1 Tax=Nonomuraea sp. NPDC047897 TaxID=3364346 RepID=UPI003724ADA1
MAPNTSCPFPGFRPYRSAEEGLFTGRAQESARVAALWRTRALTVLHGPSGIGKSSLLHAGVLPLLRRLGVDVLPVGGVTAGPIFPEAAIPSPNPLARALLRSWMPDTPLPPAGVHRFLRRAGRPGRPALVAVDHLEDAYAGDRDAARRELLGLLAPVRHVHLLLCIRDDRLDALLGEVEGLFPDIALFRLGGLAPAAAAEALRRPMRDAGRTVPPTAAEALADDLATARIVDETGGVRARERLEAVEPWQLQATCLWLWRAWPQGHGSPPGHPLPGDLSGEPPGSLPGELPRDPSRALSGELLRDPSSGLPGGVPGDPPGGPRGGGPSGAADEALRDVLWDVICRVAAGFDRDPVRLCGWLAAHLVAPSGAAGTLAEGPAETEGMPNAVLRALARRSILRVTSAGGSRAYALGHRLLAPLGQLARQAGSLGVPVFGPADRLRAALEALADGDQAGAERHARHAATTATHDLRLQIDAHTVLGNLAFAHGRLDLAQEAYERVLVLLEAQRDKASVGVMLAAIGRLSLSRGDVAAAQGLLHAAAARLPADRSVKVELARALARTGQRTAAVAILSSVMTAAEDDEARTLHRDLVAEMTDHVT